MRKNLFISSLISGTGNWITSLVIFNWVYSVTQSATWMGLGIVVHRLPMMIGGVLFSDKAENQPRLTHFKFDIIRGQLLLLMSFIVILQLELSDRSPYLFVIPFLALAALRSLLSGTDNSFKAKLFATHLEPKVAARSQQTLQYILSLTGILASVLYVVGVLSLNFFVILVFDAITFFASAWVIRALPQDPSTQGSHVAEKQKLWEVFSAIPNLWAWLGSHFLRMFGIVVLMQQSVLLLQKNFAMGPESAGYLYVGLTAAWFLSAQLVLKLRLALQIWQHYFVSALVLAISASLWLITDIFAATVLFFVAWFLDGILLTEINGVLQFRSKNEWVARVFSFLQIGTNIFIAVGTILIGLLSDSWGFSNAAMIWLTPLTVLSLVLAFAFYLMPSACEWLWIKQKMKAQNIETRMSMGALNVFLETPKDLGLKYFSFTAKSKSIRRLQAFSLQFGKQLRVADLNEVVSKAYFELLERFTISENPPNPTDTSNVKSNGVALHDTRHLAEEKARLELFERDSVLFHFCTHKPAISFYDLKTSSHAELTLAACDSAVALRLHSQSRDLAHYMVALCIEGKWAFGFASGTPKSAKPIAKAISEALCSYRVHTTQSLAELRSALAKPMPIDRTNFEATAQQLGVTPSELQMGLVLLNPPVTWLNNLKDGGEAKSLDAFISAQEPHLPLPEITYEELKVPFMAPYSVVRATSESAFRPEWPFLDVHRMDAVLRARGLSYPIHPTAGRTACVVY